MCVTPQNLQCVVSRVPKFHRADVIGNRFRTQDSNSRDFIDALRTGAFASNQFERDSKRFAIGPGNLENAGVRDGSQRFRRQGVGHRVLSANTQNNARLFY